MCPHDAQGSTAAGEQGDSFGTLDAQAEAIRNGSFAAPSSLPEVLTVDELAELLRVDRKSVYNAIKRQEIPGVRKLGKVLRIHRQTVLTWLGQGRGSRSKGRPQ